MVPMVPVVPEVRVAMVKDFMALLRGGRVPRGDEIVARADAELLGALADASRLSWMPAAPVVRLADEARTLLGPVRWRAIHRETADELAERPLFRAFMQGARAVFGATPGTFCRIFPRVLEQAHRNYGPIVAHAVDESESVIRFEDCAPEGLSLGLLEVFAGTVEGLIAPSARTASASRPGSTASVHADVEYVVGARRAAIVVRW
jgi:hypothetical protein